MIAWTTAQASTSGSRDQTSSAFPRMKTRGRSFKDRAWLHANLIEAADGTQVVALLLGPPATGPRHEVGGHELNINASAERRPLGLTDEVWFASWRTRDSSSVQSAKPGYPSFLLQAPHPRSH